MGTAEGIQPADCQVRLVLSETILQSPSKQLSKLEDIDTEDEFPPTLTTQQIIDAWENIRKRAGQKSKSKLLAAYLAYFKVIAVEGTAKLTVIVLQTEKQSNLRYLNEEDRYKDLELSLTEEFGQPCKVHLTLLANPPIDLLISNGQNQQF